MRRPSLVLAAVLALAGTGCGGAATAPHVVTSTAPLPPGVRPIGPGPRFHPPLAGRPVRACGPGLGARQGAHLELFARGFVVLFPAGIGAVAPHHGPGGRIDGARCFGRVVTIDPTGLVLVRTGTRATVGDVFAAWGQPLGAHGVAGFTGRVRAWVGGARRRGPVAAIPLDRHAEIVIEVGPFVPPHAAYSFPPGF